MPNVWSWFTICGDLEPVMMVRALALCTALTASMIAECSVSRKITFGGAGATLSHLRNSGSVLPSWSASTGIMVSVIMSSAREPNRLITPSMAVPVGPVTPDLSSTARTTQLRVGRVKMLLPSSSDSSVCGESSSSVSQV
ncbi:Uncharacterised protein [Mycobacteroides abscessus subsp. abscessus]|nr:Uncharacterised protein [Mycobacteroides abscessus subsp. abscessus]